MSQSAENDARPVGRCIGCFHDFALGPCGGCGAVDYPTRRRYCFRCAEQGFACRPDDGVATCGGEVCATCDYAVPDRPEDTRVTSPESGASS